MRSSTLAILALIFSCAIFANLAVLRIDQSTDPAFEDTGSYLEGALNIKENGGAVNFIQLCIDGTFKIAEQHPAYLLALSTFASRELSFFRKAQLFTFAVGLVLLVFTFLIGRILFDDRTAMLATLLLSLNASFLVRSSHVAVETMLMTFMLVAWYFTVKGFDDRRYWAAAGLFAGLAYMTKGTGLFLIPVFIAATLFHFRWAVLRTRYFWLFCVMFIVPCLPWVVRNLVVYQTPLYEGINNHVAWLDTWEQLSDPRHGLVVNWKEHTYTWATLPTMADYLASHSVKDIVHRMLTGSRDQFVLLLESLTLQFFPFAGVITGTAILLVCLTGVARDIRSSRGIVTCLYGLAIFLPFAWYHRISPSDRYLMPLVPLVLLYAAHAMVRAYDGLAARTTKKRLMSIDYRQVLRGGLAIVAALITVAIFVRYGVSSVDAIRVGQDQEELFSYLRATSRPDDGLLIGPTNRYWGYLWYAGYRGNMVPTAGNSPMLADRPVADFTAFLKSHRINTVVVHEENLSSPKSLQEYFRRDEVGGLSQIRPIAGWRLVHRHSAEPVRFLIYDLSPKDVAAQAGIN